MVILKKQLIESLKKAMPGIETGKSVLQGSDAFIFYKGRIYSYNPVIAVSVPIEQQFESSSNEVIEGAVDSGDFFKTVCKMPSDEINISAGDNGTWILKSGRAKAEFMLLDFDYKERVGCIETSDEWSDVPADFIYGLNICRIANNKTPVAGVYVNGKDCMSTNGYMVNNYIMAGDMPAFFLSDKTVNELCKFKSFIQISIKNSWVHLKDDAGAVFSVKTLSGEFPYAGCQKLLSNSEDSGVLLESSFPDALYTAVDRAALFSDSQKPNAKITLKSDCIEVQAEKYTGNYNESVAWNDNMPQFEPIKMRVDALMMSYMSTKNASFKIINGPEKPPVPRILFISSNSRHLLATMTL